MATSSGTRRAVCRPVIALWGRFDSPRLGEIVRAFTVEKELQRRLPGWGIEVYAPLGPRHPLAFDAGLCPSSLGPYSDDRVRELAEGVAAVVVCGEVGVDDRTLAEDYDLAGAETVRLRPSAFFLEGLGPELEQDVPFIWSAVTVGSSLEGARIRETLRPRRCLSVADEASREALYRAGVDSGVQVVPDPLLLASRTFDLAVLAQRLDHLRSIGRYGDGAPPLVVQGDRRLAGEAERIADALRPLLLGGQPVLLLEADPAEGDADLVEAIGARLAGPVFRVSGATTAIDVVAVLSRAGAVLASSRAALLVATSFGIPAARLSPERPPGPPTGLDPILERLASTLGGLAPFAAGPDLPAGASARLDEHFDVVSEIAAAAFTRRSGTPLEPLATAKGGASRSEGKATRDDSALWRTAYEVLERRSLIDRFRLADASERRERELASHLSDSEEKARGLEAELAATRAEASRLEESLGAAISAADAERQRMQAGLAAAQAEADRLRESVGLATAALDRTRSELDSSRSEGQRREEEQRVRAAAAESSRARLEEDLQKTRRSLGAVEAELASAREESARLDGRLTEEQALRARLFAELTASRAASERLEAAAGDLEGRLARANDERRATTIALERERALRVRRDADVAQAEVRMAELSEELETARSLLDSERAERLRADAGRRDARRLVEELQGAAASWERSSARLEEEAQALRAEATAARERIKEQGLLHERETAVLGNEAATLRGELAAMRSEFVRFTNLRLFRYTALPRSVYRRVRDWLGLASGAR